MAALAPSMPLLVVARLIQGYGGGAMYSLAYGIVPRVYPAHLRPKMLSLLSGVWVVTGLLGPPFINPRGGQFIAPLEIVI
jgi:MFS family permease